MYTFQAFCIALLHCPPIFFFFLEEFRLQVKAVTVSLGLSGTATAAATAAATPAYSASVNK